MTTIDHDSKESQDAKGQSVRNWDGAAFLVELSRRAIGECYQKE